MAKKMRKQVAEEISIHALVTKIYVQNQKTFSKRSTSSSLNCHFIKHYAKCIRILFLTARYNFIQSILTLSSSDSYKIFNSGIYFYVNIRLCWKADKDRALKWWFAKFLYIYIETSNNNWRSLWIFTLVRGRVITLFVLCKI